MLRAENFAIICTISGVGTLVNLVWCGCSGTGLVPSAISGVPFDEGGRGHWWLCGAV